jgi:hypothetical protein
MHYYYSMLGLYLQRRPFDCHQPVDGHALWVLWQRGQLQQQANSVLLLLSQTNDASSTHTDTCITQSGPMMAHPHAMSHVQGGYTSCVW